MCLLHLAQVEQAAVDGGCLCQLLPYGAAAVAPLAACMHPGSCATCEHMHAQKASISRTLVTITPCSMLSLRC